jgi:hypothetical protein
MQRIMKWLGLRLLAICRNAYCWVFFALSISMTYVVCNDLRSLARTHLVDRGDIVSNITLSIYSIVLGIAWWMIFRGKPALKQWAIAANTILILNYVPALIFGNWRGVLKAELDWWPIIFMGIFGIIIFSIPYHGWRRIAQ